MSLNLQEASVFELKFRSLPSKLESLGTPRWLVLPAFLDVCWCTTIVRWLKPEHVHVLIPLPFYLSCLFFFLPFYLSS